MKLVLFLAAGALAFRDLPASETEYVMTWEQWKEAFPRQDGLLHAEEKQVSFEENVEHIKACNAAYRSGEQGYYCGVNEYSDMSSEEFKAVMLPMNMTSETHGERETWLAEPAPQAGSVDWRQRGAVTQVKNQGRCGSCWSFSTTGSLEGRWQIKNNQLVSLSEEELVQCDKVDNGCKGGLMDNAFKFIEKNGITTEEAYPYTSGQGKRGSCDSNLERRPVAYVKSFQDVPRGNEAQLAAAVMEGPVSIAIEADKRQFQSYKGGVFDYAGCGKKLDHGVLVVGIQEGQYWIVKNSWGPTWGDQGYIKIKYGENLCGIAQQPSYPIPSDKKPSPSPPGPSPSSKEYENPYKGGCSEGEIPVSIQGVKGEICAPACSGNSCPDAPNGVNAQANCAIQTPQKKKYCALICQPSESSSCEASIDMTCKKIQGVGICTYNQNTAEPVFTELMESFGKNY